MAAGGLMHSYSVNLLFQPQNDAAALTIIYNKRSCRRSGITDQIIWDVGDRIYIILPKKATSCCINIKFMQLFLVDYSSETPVGDILTKQTTTTL